MSASSASSTSSTYTICSTTLTVKFSDEYIQPPSYILDFNLRDNLYCQCSDPTQHIFHPSYTTSSTLPVKPLKPDISRHHTGEGERRYRASSPYPHIRKTTSSKSSKSYSSGSSGGSTRCDDVCPHCYEDHYDSDITKAERVLRWMRCKRKQVVAKGLRSRNKG
jgi:hypothetical protein